MPTTVVLTGPWMGNEGCFLPAAPLDSSRFMDPIVSEFYHIFSHTKSLNNHNYLSNQNLTILKVISNHFDP